MFPPEALPAGAEPGRGGGGKGGLPGQVVIEQVGNPGFWLAHDVCIRNCMTGGYPPGDQKNSPINAWQTWLDAVENCLCPGKKRPKDPCAHLYPGSGWYPPLPPPPPGYSFDV